MGWEWLRTTARGPLCPYVHGHSLPACVFVCVRIYFEAELLYLLLKSTKGTKETQQAGGLKMLLQPGHHLCLYTAEVLK